MSREELEKEAESLGIKVDGRWGDEKLAEKITAAKAESTEESAETTETEFQKEAEFVEKAGVSETTEAAIAEEVAEAETVDESPSSKYANGHNGKLQLSDGTVIEPGKSIELTEEQLQLNDVKRLIEIKILRDL